MLKIYYLIKLNINSKINILLNSNLKQDYGLVEETITNELCNVLKTYGTENMNDLLYVCFPNLTFEKSIENIILSYFHPIGYKMSLKKKHKEGWLFSEMKTTDSFLGKIYGLTLTFFYNKYEIVLYGIVDDIPIHFFNDKLIINKLNYIKNMKPNTSIYLNNEFDHYIKTITFKDLLIYNEKSIFEKYEHYYKTIYEYKNLNISELIDKFIECSLYDQRKIIIYLLTKTDETHLYYISYLLYDLLSNDINGNVDTQEQTLLFDSLPFEIKKNFKIAMKITIDYTNKLSNNTNNNIPLEQQICLMNCNDSIKEKYKVEEMGKETVITLGSNRSTVFRNNEWTNVEAYKPKAVIDTTGAGDLFAAGYLHGTCLNLDAENCSKIGSIVASEIISHVGPRPTQSLKNVIKDI